MASILAKKNLESELTFLEDLFRESLPVGDNTETIKEYFSCLKKLIYTNDGEFQIEREEFPPDDPAICGEREYRYYSADKFKELAGRHQHPNHGQNVGHPESKQADLHAKQDSLADAQDMEYIQECPHYTTTFHADSNDNHLPGELDTRDSSEFFDEPIN
jgi:hypothetical protein